jgi:hypothetical protein
MDWKEYEDDPIGTFDQIREFFKDDENKDILKRLAGGLAVATAVAAGKYAYTQHKNYKVTKKNNRYKIKEK